MSDSPNPLPDNPANLELPPAEIKQSDVSINMRGIVKHKASAWPIGLGNTLFALALGIYLATRLIGLTRFPIYFFTDEAIHTVQAARLVHNKFEGPNHEFLPTYFMNGPYYNLSSSVYIQILPYLIFGRSAYATRATSVLITLIGAIGVAVILRKVFKLPHWWMGTLLLSIAPAWFLHSRTAFETAEFVAFYAGMLCTYLLYRYQSTRYVFLMIVLGALAFYAYSPGRAVILVTGMLLFISDLGYHWKHRSIVFAGLILAVILGIPLIRFQITYPQAATSQLSNLGSYWIQPIPLKEKLSLYQTIYLKGLSPVYWFSPQPADLLRHLMKGYGNLLFGTLPFAFLGFVIALWEGLGRAFWNFVRRKTPNPLAPAYRAILIAMLAAPSGSALVGIGITRVLVFVIPATLFIAIGLSRLLAWISEPSQPLNTPNDTNDQTASVLSLLTRWKTWRLPHTWVAWAVFAVLSIYNLHMLRDSLINGPLWYRAYDLGGLQYGAFQIFDEVEEYAEQHPDTHITLSPSWANGTDVLAEFFLHYPTNIQMGTIEGHFYRRLPLDDRMVFVMIPSEYTRVLESGKFTNIRVDQTLAYPDGTPGFYFVRLSYVSNIDEILAKEYASRQQLIADQVIIDGQLVQIRHSLLDMGNASMMFDNNPDTVARTMEANPFVIELTFPEPRPIREISMIIGSTHVQITARLYAQPGASPIEFSTDKIGTVSQPQVTLDFGQMVAVQVLYLAILDPTRSEPTNIHIWEIYLRDQPSN